MFTRVCWGKMFKLILLSLSFSYCYPQTVTETKFRKITSDIKESFFLFPGLKLIFVAEKCFVNEDITAL